MLRVPVSALFRDGDDWMVFVAKDGVAVKQLVQIGQRNTSFAEIVEGLQEGTEVVAHPSDNISEGTPIVPRTTG